MGAIREMSKYENPIGLYTDQLLTSPLTLNPWGFKVKVMAIDADGVKVNSGKVTPLNYHGVKGHDLPKSPAYALCTNV